MAVAQHPKTPAPSAQQVHIVYGPVGQLAGRVAQCGARRPRRLHVLHRHACLPPLLVPACRAHAGTWSAGGTTQPCEPCGADRLSPVGSTSADQCYSAHQCPAGTEWPPDTSGRASTEECVCKPGVCVCVQRVRRPLLCAVLLAFGCTPAATPTKLHAAAATPRLHRVWQQDRQGHVHAVPRQHLECWRLHGGLRALPLWHVQQAGLHFTGRLLRL
jgi:hypothetical protein